MTKSTITREQLIKKAQEQIEFCRHTKITGEGRAHVNQCAALFEIALAAMDSEPVIVVGDDGGDALSYRRLIQSFEPGTKLYRHAQTAPVVPEGKPIPNTLSMYAVDAVATIAEVKGWNACRAAMMQELKKSAGTEAICRSDENVQVLHTKSPAQSDCCPAQNVVVPAQSPIDHGYLPECECSGCKATARICTEMAVNSLVIPNEMTSEQAYEIGYYYGDPVNVFARGANWMRQHIIDSTLAAAPQLPGSEPATVPGKWIPVSERMPEVGVKVLCFPVKDEPIHATFNGQLWLQDVSWSGSEEPIDNVIPVTVTHWMPLPTGPQEVKDAHH